MIEKLFLHWSRYLNTAAPSIFKQHLSEQDLQLVSSLLAALNVQAHLQFRQDLPLGETVKEAEKSGSAIWKLLGEYISIDSISLSTHPLLRLSNINLNKFCYELVNRFSSFLENHRLSQEGWIGAKIIANTICLHGTPASCLVSGSGGFKLGYLLSCKGSKTVVKDKSDKLSLLIQVLTTFQDIPLMPYSSWEADEKIESAIFIPTFKPRADLFGDEEKKIIHFIQGKFFSLCLPVSLIRSSSSAIKEREMFIQEYGLDTVITLPERAWDNISIRLGLLCFAHSLKKIEAITFVDLPSAFSGAKADSASELVTDCIHILEKKSDEEHVTRVPVPEIAEKNWDLSRSSYIQNPEAKDFKEFINKFKELHFESLSSRFEVIRCQSLSRFIPEEYIENESKPLNDSVAVYEFRLSNIGQDGEILSDDLKPFYVPLSDIKEKIKKQKLQAGDVLLNVLGGMSKIAIVREAPKKEFVANQSIVILRSKYPENKIPNGLYLYFYLLNPAVRSYLYAKKDSLLLRSSLLPLKQLSELPIPVPNKKLLELADVIDSRTLLLEKKIQLLQKKKEALVNNFFNLASELQSK